MKEIIEELTRLNKTVATMESCTGGGLVNAITNVEGASNVIFESIVTYSNNAKIKYGVRPEIIEACTVYSTEVAMEMSRAISMWTGADYGIGITGQLNRVDENNPYGISNQVFVSIYDRANDYYKTFDTFVTKDTRPLNKEEVIELIIANFKEMILGKSYVKKNQTVRK